MREIKFRFWHKAHKRFAEGGYIFSGDGFEASIHLTPMQYTGFKDKNGVEIYEGDIVRPDDNGELFPEEYNEETDEWEPSGKFEIYWSEDSLCFWLRPTDNNVVFEPEYNVWFDASFEVIGNIYENPELLSNG